MERENFRKLGAHRNFQGILSDSWSKVNFDDFGGNAKAFEGFFDNLGVLFKIAAVGGRGFWLGKKRKRRVLLPIT